ncbi:hypothetical protein JCM8547_004821 [Rhodosporidiobolus lusitaniae]
MTRPSSPSYSDDRLLPSTVNPTPSSSPQLPSTASHPPAHSTYDIDTDDDNEIEQTLAFLEKHGGGERRPSLGNLAKVAARGVNQRNLGRRALLLALVGAFVLVGVIAGARGAGMEGAEGWRGRAAGLRKTGEEWKDKVVGGVRALVWNGAGLDNPDYAGPYEGLDTMKVVKNPGPADTLREQLKEGVRYVTALAYGGHANQLIGIQKMLYFAKMTNRVGIIPSLIPVHIDGPPLPISTFYDLDRFWAESRIPAVEMTRVKALDLDSERPHNERLSCWSVQEATAGFANLNGAWSFDLHDIWIDHWPLPPTLARGLGGFDIAFDALRLFDFDFFGRVEWVQKVQREFLPQNVVLPGQPPFTGDPASNLKDGFDTAHTLPPDDQIMCFDNTLFLGPIMFPEAPVTDGALPPAVGGEGLSWMNAGQHLRFNQAVEDKADEYLVQLFGVSKPDKIPPFISIHLRRGDFKEFAGYTGLDKYIAALERVRKALQERLNHPKDWSGPGKRHFRDYGIKASEYAVVATTDEKGESEFVKSVKELGWKVLDHEAFQTKEKLGGWWPTMLDGAILARGRSFVGTDKSTFSHLGGLRVKYWRGGLVESAI